jgi:hypothetical protein
VNIVALRVHVRGMCSSHVGDLLTQLGILDNMSESSLSEAASHLRVYRRFNVGTRCWNIEQYAVSACWTHRLSN